MGNKQKCENCGSKFELINQHDTHTHLNHREKLKLKIKFKILCVTCEYFEDYFKNLHCFHKALEKRYNKQMEKAGF